MCFISSFTVNLEQQPRSSNRNHHRQSEIDLWPSVGWWLIEQPIFCRGKWKLVESHDPSCLVTTQFFTPVLGKFVSYCFAHSLLYIENFLPNVRVIALFHLQLADFGQNIVIFIKPCVHIIWAVKISLFCCFCTKNFVLCDKYVFVSFRLVLNWL